MRDYKIRKPTEDELSDWKKWFLKENNVSRYTNETEAFEWDKLGKVQRVKSKYECGD